MNEIKIGDKIQDFRLRDDKEKEVHLDDFRGKKVLLHRSIRLPGQEYAQSR